MLTLLPQFIKDITPVIDIGVDYTRQRISEIESHATNVYIEIQIQIAYINKNDMSKTVQEILKDKKGSIKNAKKPPGTPSWDDLIRIGITLDEIQKLAKGDSGWHAIYKLLTDGRFNK